MLASLLNGPDCETIKQNENDVSVYFTETKMSLVSKKVQDFLGVDFVTFYIGEKVNKQDTFTINEKDYRVFTTKDYREEGDASFSEVLAYFDVFTNNVAVYPQKITSGVPSLPEKGDKKGELVCKISTRGKKSHDEYSLIKDLGGTHFFTALLNFDSVYVEVNNALVWNDRQFEVLYVEDIEEKKEFLKMIVKEVIATTKVDVDDDENEGIQWKD